MRIGPHQIKPSDTDGEVLAIVDGHATWAPAVTPPEPLVTVVNGEPGLVFDNDGQIVYLEGS